MCRHPFALLALFSLLSPSHAASCTDQHLECFLWATLGECEHNPYVTHHCEASCGICELSGADGAAAPQVHVVPGQAMPPPRAQAMRQCRNCGQPFAIEPGMNMCSADSFRCQRCRGGIHFSFF